MVFTRLALVLLGSFCPRRLSGLVRLSAFATGILTIYYDFGAIEQSVVFGIFPSSSPLPAGLFYAKVIKTQHRRRKVQIP